MVKYLLALTLLISGCASVPKWSDNPADCAYETGRFDEGFGKDIVTGVAKQVTRRYICVENPQVVRLPSYLELLNLPPAEDMPVVTVYNFLDKTGQRKSVENIASFSTAVTQGGVEMVIDALVLLQEKVQKETLRDHVKGPSQVTSPEGLKQV